MRNVAKSPRLPRQLLTSPLKFTPDQDGTYRFEGSELGELLAGCGLTLQLFRRPRGDSNPCVLSAPSAFAPRATADKSAAPFDSLARERAHAPARSGPTAGTGTIGAFCGLCRLFHPHIPCQRPDRFIVKGTARDLQRQLDLSLVIALVPDQMLEHQDRMVVVPIHRAA